jgi:hypothetical protein
MQQSFCGFDIFPRYEEFPAIDHHRPKHRFKLRGKLYPPDATGINLRLFVFPGAKLRQTKGAIKLYAGLDGDGYFSEFLKFKARVALTVQQMLRLLQLYLFAPWSFIELFKHPDAQPPVSQQLLLRKNL